MSKQWYTNKENTKIIKQLKDNVYNYIRNVEDAKGDEILWTCFKSDIPVLKGKGYTKSHLSCNCRSTNEYSSRKVLIYLVNRYVHPGVQNYFNQVGIVVNNELYALSEMIQWIWRSRIRNGESIDIYIPCDRMRELLEKWLDNGFNDLMKQE